MTDRTVLAAAVAIATLAGNGALADQYKYNVRGLGASGEAYGGQCSEQGCVEYSIYIGVREEVTRSVKDSQFHRYKGISLSYTEYDQDYYDIKSSCFGNDDNGWDVPKDDFDISPTLKSATLAPTTMTVWCWKGDEYSSYDVDVSASWAAIAGPYFGRYVNVNHDPLYYYRSTQNGRWFDAEFKFSVSAGPWRGLAWNYHSGNIGKSDNGDIYIWK